MEFKSCREYLEWLAQGTDEEVQEDITEVLDGIDLEEEDNAAD